MARFNAFSEIGNTVSGEMFGANAIFDINTLTDGSIRTGYLDAILKSGTQDIRFPGGLVELEFNVVRMDDGNLREEVINFFNDVRAVNQSGTELTVSIVLPTQSYLESVEYTDFVSTVVTQFGDIISSFEIGNEYSIGAPNPNGLFSEHPEVSSVRPTQYGISEATYGQQVERIAKAVETGIQLASLPGSDSNNPDIVMQMSDIVGGSSSFRYTNDHESADRAILSQLSAETIEIIDGFVGHYYYNESHSGGEGFDGDWREVRSFPERIESWNSVVEDLFGAEHTQKDLSFTEWNTNIRTTEQVGLKGASVQAKQIEYMIEMGADSAFVWPLQHNTNSSVAGHHMDTAASLSPSGQVFATLNDLMNPNLNGSQDFRLTEASFSWLDNRLDAAAYTSDYSSIFVISNRSFDIVSETVGFRDGFGSIDDGTLFTIGIDQSTSDGLLMGGDENGMGRLARRTIDNEEYLELASSPYFDAENANHIKIVGNSFKTYLVDPSQVVPKFSGATNIGDFWFVNEGDVSGSLTIENGMLGPDNQWATLELNPFEVSIIEVIHSKNIEGSGGNNVIYGGKGSDSILARGGDDIVFGYDGNDTLKGGWGDDHLNGGSGDNYLTGSFGNDFFDLSKGQSTVAGGDGIDTVSYADAAPSIRVDLMFDQINARDAYGDSFSDVENLIGTLGADNIRGTLSNNVLSGEGNVDYIFGRRGDDSLDGGLGNDVLFGGVGSDVLNGGAHRDRAQYSESLTAVRVDLTNPHTNTGEATGDVFISIEDLAGSRFNDTLFGNEESNGLYGREGDDTLTGEAGNDYLNGGSGDDVLIGGMGDDILRGGQGADVFIFDGGHDVFEDFDTTRDSFETSSLILVNADAVSTEVSNGNTILNFGEHDSINFLNVESVYFGEYFDLF